MGMTVDQPRHQRAATAVDDRRAHGFNYAIGHLLDQVALDQHAHAHGELFGLAVEDVDVGDQDLRFGLIRRDRRCGGKQGAACNHESDCKDDGS